MGACLELQTATAPFAVEARRESLCIGTGITGDVLHARGAANGIPAAVAIPRQHVAAVLAGLDQADDHITRYGWPRDPDPLVDPWQVHEFGSEIIVQGPVYVWVDTKWTPTSGCEIEYRHINQLRDALAEHT